MNETGPGDGSGQDGGRVTDSVDPPEADEPPHPAAPHAGAQAPSRRTTTGTDAPVVTEGRIAPRSGDGPATDPPACTGFSGTLGRCVRDDGEGHPGLHRNKDRETWA